MKLPTEITQILKALPAEADAKSWLKALSEVLERFTGTIEKLPKSPESRQARKDLLEIQRILPRLQQTVEILSRDREALRGLYEVGQSVNSSLDLDEVLRLLMDQILQLTGAERAFLMLRNQQTQELEFKIALNVERGEIEGSEFQVSRTVVEQVAKEGKPVITTNAQTDPRFAAQESIVEYNLRSILCVPLQVRDQAIGVLYADNRVKTGLFTFHDLDTLAACANQAAIAIENARLFDNVRKHLQEISEMKDLMDNVFSSMASGVLTTDDSDRIALLNQSAERIFGVSAQDVIRRRYMEALPAAADLDPLVQEVKRSDEVITRDLTPTLPDRSQVSWRLSVAPLRNAARARQGVAIVIDDQTEPQFIRNTFQRYVGPQVVQRLLSDPSLLKLGGERRCITILYADIRGFTSFSEDLPPETLVEILNTYLGMAAGAVIEEEGTLDKFMGDAVMAIFNAPLDQDDHPLRAVRCAISLQSRLAKHQEKVPPEERLSFGVGIHSGDAVIGNIGDAQQQNYTAIGDSVNYARRLQECARAGQILISESLYKGVEPYVRARMLNPLTVKGRSHPETVFEVFALK